MDGNPAPKVNPPSLWILAASLTAVVLGGGYLFWNSPSRRDLRRCDEEIMRQLKAPSTYQRIDGSNWSGNYHITYDAQNSYGVPIRSNGLCFISKSGVASWQEWSGQGG